MTPVSKTPQSPARFDNDWLCKSLQSIVGSPVSEVVCSPLQGDASDRKYHRVFYQTEISGKPLKSMILMQLEEPLPGQDNDFTRILKFLRTLELPVPRLFHYHSDKGLLFLEDLGSQTLEDWIRDHPEDKEAYYRQAVDLLARLHHRATKKISADCPAFHLHFDVEKLMWELDFMIEHYVKGLHQSHLNDREISEIRGHFLSLCQTLAKEEPVFTHRDFHSRNLMAQNGNLIILDFQDARMGPCQYDLVSLLKDSYVHLDEKFRNDLIERYIQLKEKADNRPVDRQEFHRIFDCMSIQRNLKAVGTFAFQAVAKGNRRYLEYIPETLTYVSKTLEKRQDLLAMKKTLVKYLPGLTPEITKGN
jgi:aminoglycoside/choline kinase family phosphotransferase